MIDKSHLRTWTPENGGKSSKPAKLHKVSSNRKAEDIPPLPEDPEEL
jgi:hypothetical protein